jgi:hypothetical protein
MIAAVLTLLWQDIAGVRELTRILARDGFLCCNPTKVSQGEFKMLLIRSKDSWVLVIYGQV